MWKEALLKKPAAMAEVKCSTTTPDPTTGATHYGTSPSSRSSPSSTCGGVGSTTPVGVASPNVGASNSEVPSIEYFANLRSANKEGPMDGTNSVTSTEVTFRSHQGASITTRSESWADDDDDFLDSFTPLSAGAGAGGGGSGAGGGGAYGGGARSPQAQGKKGGWKAVNAGTSQGRGGGGNKSDNRGQGRGQDYSRKNRGGGSGGGSNDRGGYDAPQASTSQSSNGRFDALNFRR